MNPQLRHPDFILFKGQTIDIGRLLVVGPSDFLAGIAARYGTRCGNHPFKKHRWVFNSWFHSVFNQFTIWITSWWIHLRSKLVVFDYTNVFLAWCVHITDQNKSLSQGIKYVLFQIAAKDKLWGRLVKQVQFHSPFLFREEYFVIFFVFCRACISWATKSTGDYLQLKSHSDSASRCSM